MSCSPCPTQVPVPSLPGCLPGTCLAACPRGCPTEPCCSQRTAQACLLPREAGSSHPVMPWTAGTVPEALLLLLPPGCTRDIVGRQTVQTCGTRNVRLFQEARDLFGFLSLPLLSRWYLTAGQGCPAVYCLKQQCFEHPGGSEADRSQVSAPLLSSCHSHFRQDLWVGAAATILS